MELKTNPLSKFLTMEKGKTHSNELGLQTGTEGVARTPAGHHRVTALPSHSAQRPASKGDGSRSKQPLPRASRPHRLDSQ